MEDENIQNDNMQDHSEEAIDVNNNEYLNDQNYRISDDVAPSPGQFNPNMNNPNIPYEMYNNDINELDVDINSQNLEDAQSQEDVNNPDLDNENENENFNNEEQEEFEQDEMNDNDNEINEGNEINELNINDEKDMNYIENDNINQENDLNNVNANNNMNEFNDNNIDDEENNPNLENMDMPQNDPMINDINNNNDIDNMNEINNEEDNFNNINDNDNDNDNNNFESSDMHDDLNNNNLNNNNMNNIKYMNYMYNNNLNNMNNNKGNPLLMAQRNQAFDPGYDQEDDEGFNNPEMNDMNNINNINNNMINNNENNVENQQLMEHIEEINGRFFDLEKEFKFLEKENKELKRQLQYEKMKNREMKPNDFLIYDNTLKQGKLFLEDQKKKNAELKKIINDLEEQKKASDYKLIEANQKIKRLENDFNIINNNNQKEENKNNSNDNNNKNNDSEIINLKNKIDEYEIANSKLVLDNENLKKKMDSIEKEYKNQIKIFVQYKNSEIKTYHNTISQYKDYFKNHKINPNVNKQINKEGNNIVNKDNNNNNLDYGTIMVEMGNKDNLIKSLNSKLDKYMNEYKDIIGEKQLVQQKCNEMQFANQKLMNENNDLKEKNENLKTELSNLNQKVKMNKIKYKNNEYIFNQNMTQMKDKLAEYKQKVIMLKMKIKELIGDNQPSKLLKQQSNNNYAKNPNFNNFLDIKQIPLTPTQKKKFSGMSHGNIKINKRQEDSSNFGTNEFYYNKMENINNNF